MNCSRFGIFTLGLALAAALAFLPGCNEKEKTSSTSMSKSSSASSSTTTNLGAVNEMCSCGHPLGKAPVYEAYNGKNLAFCCRECRTQFDKMTLAEKDAHVAKMTAGKVSMGAMNDKCPFTGAAVNKSAPTSTYNGKTIGFCCGGCAAKFEALSPAQKDEKLAKMAAK